MARQAGLCMQCQSHNSALFGPLQVVSWADVAEKQLARLDHSVFKLSGDVCSFGVWLRQASHRDPHDMFEV